MDAGTTANPTGNKDYAFFNVGGISWTAPYLAGIYALACQVDPKITPEEFWSTALQTGKITQIHHDGEQYSFGIILDPQDLIAALQNKKTQFVVMVKCYSAKSLPTQRPEIASG